MIFKNEIVHDINNKNYGEKEKKSLLLDSKSSWKIRENVHCKSV